MKQKHSIIIVLILLALGCFSPEPLWADPFKSTDQARRDSMVDSALSGRSAHTWNQGNYKSAPLASHLEDDIDFGDAAQLLPDTRQRSFHAAVPMGGFADVINAPSYGLLHGQAALSLLAMQNVALNLTEPAVGAGTSAANEMAGLWLSQRYLAERDFLERIGTNPEQRQLILEAYNNCISEKLSLAKGWVQAQDECLPADRPTSRSSTFVAPAGLAGTVKGSDHPEWMVSGSDPQQANDINILHLLFPVTANPQNLEVQTHFKRYFGTVTLSLPKVPNSSGGAAGLLTESMVTESRKHRPEIDPRVTYNLLVQEKYAQLMGALSAYCQFRPNTANQIRTLNIQVTPLNHLGLWFEMPDAEFFSKQLSLHGFLLVRPPIFDPLLDLYKSVEASCPEAGDFEVPQGTSNVKEWERAYLFFARRLAWGELLGRFLNAQERVIKSHGGSALHNTARNEALGLIYTVAGTDNIMAAYEENLQALRGAVDDIFERHSQKSGGNLGSRVSVSRGSFSMDR